MRQDLSVYTDEYYKRDQPEYWFTKHGILRPDQLAALCYAYGLPFWGEPDGIRDPGLVYSIGCGSGELEAALEKLGNTVVGVDPSRGAKALYKGKDIVDEYPGGGDTVIFCESIEHIPHDITKGIFSRIPKQARVIVVNWPDLHPIPAVGDGDHITDIDDVFYDRLSDGRKVILRRGSHLVLEGEAK